MGTKTHAQIPNATDNLNRHSATRPLRSSRLAPWRDLTVPVRQTLRRGSQPTARPGARSSPLVDRRCRTARSGDIWRAIRLLDITLSNDEFAERMLIQEGGDRARHLEDGPLEETWLRIDREFHFRPTMAFFEVVINSIARENTFHRRTFRDRSLQSQGLAFILARGSIALDASGPAGPTCPRSPTSRCCPSPSPSSEPPIAVRSPSRCSPHLKR